MADFAKAEFALGVKQEDGSTLKDHLISSWLQTGVMDPQLAEAPDIPSNCSHVWDYYLELHNRRPNYGFGHIALSFIEIEAWQRLTHRRLDVWELKALLEIDVIYIAFMATIAKNNKDK